MIGIVYALVGLLVLVTGSSITFAVMNSRARDERESARILASSTGSELRVARDTIDSLKRSLKSEQERSDALDDELAKTYDVADPAGARERVLQKWKAEHDLARGRTLAMPAPATASKPGPDGLIDPFAPG